VGTSYTPRTKLTAGKTYRWQVKAVTQSGREGASLLAGSQPTFTVAASTATPQATPQPTSPAGISGSRFPTLEWVPVTGATSYTVLVREAGTVGGFVKLADTFAYPAGEDDTTAWLSPGTYEWMVEAYNGSVPLSQSATTSTFTILPPTQVTGESLAMSGLALENDTTSCSNALDPAKALADQQCVDLRATPVLSWNPDPEVGYYQVWLSRDQQLTNVVSGYPVSVESTHYTPRVSLIDSQAGSAFYWFVQPCKVDAKCASPQHAQHAFNKLSKPVETISPSAGDEQANDITFTWRDYLATNQDPATPTTPTPSVHTGVRSIEPDVEARQYRLQVDDEPNFQSPLETVIVDQTTYTSYANTYPEGPLYWRVQAIDGSSNSLTWSDPVSFTKASPTVALQGATSPSVSGARPLRWDPLAFAASYDVEVYKNGDTIGSPANRVVTGNSKQVAFSLALPLEVSDASYTWRVRPVDAKDRKGPWTSLDDADATFRVIGDAPNLTTPLEEEIVTGNDALFTWQPPERASTYKFERRLEGQTGVAETRTTPALAWAPTSTIPNGSWEWRVSALDSTGKVIRASAWRSFRVDSTRPTVTSATPSTSVSRTTNFVAKFSEPVTGVSSRTYRIYKSGSTSPLTATVTLNSTRTKATLNPAANLKSGVSYVIKLTSKICDDAENKLTAYSWKVRAQ
jgi:large repetitive protein